MTAIIQVYEENPAISESPRKTAGCRMLQSILNFSRLPTRYRNVWYIYNV